MYTHTYITNSAVRPPGESGDGRDELSKMIETKFNTI